MKQPQPTVRAMIPQGVATFLPEAAYLKRVIEREILTVFFKWGFQEIITPIFEYLDVVSLGMEREAVEKGYKIVDRSNGRVMILRPDVTPQVARMVAMLFSEYPKPIRLCYRENVFRHEGEHEGREREIFQVGGELIGLGGPEADAEMVAIVVQALRRLGLPGFKVILGQVELSRHLIQTTNLSGGYERQLREGLVKKDIGLVRTVLKRSRLSRPAQGRFLELITLVGGAEALKEARKLLTGGEARKALKNLGEVYRLLQIHGAEDRVLIDFGEIRGLEYYTGVFYEVFATGVGYEIGRGGRYDHLVEKFGVSTPSTGFAFDLERLELALSAQGRRTAFSTADLLVAGPREKIQEVVWTARKFRNLGYRVVQRVLERETVGELRTYSKHIGISAILILDRKGNTEVTVIDVRSGKKQKESLKGLFLFRAHPFWLRGIGEEKEKENNR